MGRDKFIDSLMRFTPKNMSETQMDAIEQFCFGLYDKSDISALRTQLAKANERVKGLEKERDHRQRMYNSLLGDLSAGYGKSSIAECEKHLNKFAIEKKIEALEGFKSAFDAQNDYWGNSPMAYVGDLDKAIEQLRKE